MSLTQILSVVRDAAILGALAFLVWRIYSDGENAVKAQDLEAVTQQIANNAKQTATWAEEESSAEAQRKADLANLTSAITAQRAPVIVRLPGGAGAVSGAAAKAASSAAAARGSNAGPGTDVDIREGIDAFELKYEGYLATCRSVLSRWPQ